MAEHANSDKHYPEPTERSSSFVSLHTHTDTSLLDGHTLIPDLVDRVKELGMTAVGISDHGNLHNAYNLYSAAKSAGIKAVLGIEAYCAPSPISHKNHEAYFFSSDESKRSDDVSSKGAYTHLLLFAKNNTGLKNLFKLSELSYTEGYYRKPRMSLELFEQYHEGLIATSGCPSGEIQTKLRLGMKQEALDFARKMQGIFGKENYFIELMDHDMKIDLERKVVDDLLWISKELDAPLLATGDTHYTRPEDAVAHEHMLCISTHSTMKVPTSLAEGEGGKTRFAFDGQGYYVKSADEMYVKFPESKFPGAVSNTKKLADMCEVEIVEDVTLRPGIPLPEGETEESWLRKEAYTGLKRRLPEKAETEEYKNRLEYELNVILERRFAGYFLVVSDFQRWAKANDIPCGFGRGSAAGSLLAYVMDITDADPIRFGLIFERFLNPERDSPPDIDTDFNDSDRDRVIDYVKMRYGVEKVAQVVTFGKILAKNSIKDTVRILDEPYSLGDQLTKVMPDPVFGKTMPLHNMITPGSDRYEEADAFRDLVKETHSEHIVEIASQLEGRTRSTGVHASALIISSKDISEHVPMMMRQDDKAMITQWDYPTSESVGLIKFDFLGLRNLGIIRDAVEFIQRKRGINLSVQELIHGPMDDPKTYRLLQQGNTLTVFQLDGCLDGNTLLSNNMTIKELYEFRQNGGKLSTLKAYDLSNGTVKNNQIVNVIQSGIKPVYRLVTESGKYIEATKDHKFMTDNGWKPLGEIDVNRDKVLVSQVGIHKHVCEECGKPLGHKSAKTKWKQGQLCYICSSTKYSNPSKSQSRKAISDSSIRTYENGRVVWNKGLDKHAHPSLMIMSEKSIASEKGRNVLLESMGIAKYEEHMDRMSKKFSGRGNPMFGKPSPHAKRGFRKDLGHFVRSTWEADYARILNFVGEPYEYEKETFLLTTGDGQELNYTPDFWLPKQNKFVEIKGFMRDIDALKIKLFQEQYNYKLDIVQKAEFAELEFKYKNLVDWECPEIPKSSDFEVIKEIVFVDDRMTYDIEMKAPHNNFIANGFMVHNSGMQSLLKLLKPTAFDDISAVLSLYRPGPMGVNAHTDYALRKNNLQDVTPIHPDLETPLKDILGETWGLIVYQEQIQFIARELAGYSLGQADMLRRAMGKKKKYILDAEFEPFSKGMLDHGFKMDAIQALWDTMVPFADYAFNKCVSDRTKIRVVGYDEPKTAREVLKMYDVGQEVWLQSMWADGEVKPHKVKNVVATGVKPIFRLTTQSGRTIEATKDHRLMTTRGYLQIQEMQIGKDELIVADRISTEQQRIRSVQNIRKAHEKPLTTAQINARRETMNKWNHDGGEARTELDKRASKRMKEYQATLTFEDRSKHQQYINQITDRGVKVSEIMRKAKSEKYLNDPLFRAKVINQLAELRKIQKLNGQNYGIPAIASNGMECDSQNELHMAEYLIELGIPFEMHKPVGLGECDFYFDGIYWEMDGMDRDVSYFERKYGDIHYVIVYPEDYRERIEERLNIEHVRNGDLIISIEPVHKKLATIDIMMEEDGPKNYLTWKGIVSHNSHTVGYGLISYVTAYLKANYTAEYMAAVLSSVSDDVDKTAAYLEDCRQNGITVLPPDISYSQVNYEPEDEKTIRFGLKAIRGIGESVSSDIVKYRHEDPDNQDSPVTPYKDWNDFIQRVPKELVNKRILEGLAYGGALDSLGLSRRAIIHQLPEFLKEFQKKSRADAKKNKQSVDLFDLGGFDEFDKSDWKMFPMDEFPRMEKLKLERTALGLYVSDHPINGLNIENMASTTVSNILSGVTKPLVGWPGPRDVPVRIAGVLTSLVIKRTKKGDAMAIARLEDRTGSIEAPIFPKTYQKVGEFLSVDNVYQFVGFPQNRDESINFMVDNIRPLDFSDSGNLSVRIKLTESQWERGQETLRNILTAHKIPMSEVGDDVVVSLKGLDGTVREIVMDIKVKRSPALVQQIQAIFGSISLGRWMTTKKPVVEQEPMSLDDVPDEGTNGVTKMTEKPKPVTNDLFEL